MKDTLFVCNSIMFLSQTLSTATAENATNSSSIVSKVGGVSSTTTDEVRASSGHLKIVSQPLSSSMSHACGAFEEVIVLGKEFTMTLKID
ncbi:hypothetical protein VIGAN_04302500 [Vigna angularis var. angularis]|uniref:Uncharacterized protein n=1 Tax=Vigna angularis var. angularis TaxID=157739 RepID=A0A0S3RYA1_PHAAN|nr:hypothetical protein VIGAN_04302500 [Vigna angularis var. angularis]